MTMLIIGLLLWSLVHATPALVPGFRSRLIARLGEYGYKAVFTVGIAVSLYLVIRGWKIAPAELLYIPPSWGRHATALLVLFMFVTFFAPYMDNNIRRITRHPQLLGTAAWSLGHLLANGELRSVILFGGVAAWALLEIVLINRRDGDWSKPAQVPVSKDAKLILTGIGFYLVVLYMHLWLFGVSPLPA